MTELFLTLGLFGVSAKYTSAFGEVTIPGVIKLVDQQRVTVEDDVFGNVFSIDVIEMISPSPAVGEAIDFVVLVEPTPNSPGIASERRACRIGLTVESSFGVVAAVNTQSVTVESDGTQQNVAISPHRHAPKAGDTVRVERHVSGAIWLA
jgi:hypothetical protein